MQLGLPLVIGLLVAATALAITAKRARLPYNVALVAGGLLIALGGVLPAMPGIDPAVVFYVCLPLLLFEGGISANLAAIRANLVPILVLAAPGLLLAIGATGAALHALLDVPWGTALLLAAVLSNTDTISVLFAFRRVAVPQRLAGIIESESLFNDGTALVAYGAIVAVVASGAQLSPGQAAGQAVLATLGGLALGLAAGLLVDFLLRRTDEPLTEIMATSALALGVYLAAERMHLSGAIAAVTAGLTVGAGLRRSVSPRSRISMAAFWEFMAFGVNTFLFLSVGLATSLASMGQHLLPIALAVVAVFFGRAVATYLPLLLVRAVRPAAAVPTRWQHVLVAGNIKGAIAIALALGLPADAPGRELVINVAFGVAVVSILLQAPLLPPFLRWLGVVTVDVAARELDAEQARLLAARAAGQELESLQRAGLVPRVAYDLLRSEYQVTIAGAERQLRSLQDRHLAQGARSLVQTRRRLVDAERAALVAARRAGLIGPEAADRLLEELDDRLLRLERILSGELPEPEAR